MTKSEYIRTIVQKLTEKDIEPSLKWQIVETIEELLKYYSIEFVQELLPSLLQPNQSSQKND